MSDCSLPTQYPWSKSGAAFVNLQERLWSLIMKSMPKVPCKVLLLGSPSRDCFQYLTQEGYEIHELDLSQNKRQCVSSYETTVTSDHFFSEFVEQEFGGNGSFDVMLLMEALKYLKPLDTFMKKARMLLKPKGRIIICDEVLFGIALSFQKDVISRKELTVAFYENGFFEKKSIDITQEIVQDIKLIRIVLDEGSDLQPSFRDTDGTSEDFLSSEEWKKKIQCYHDGLLEYTFLLLIKDDIFLKTYQCGDEHRILPLFNNIFSTNRSIEHWKWKFKDNPYGKEFIVLAVDQEDKIAAHYCGYPVKFYSKYSAIESFVSIHVGDTFTSPAFRSVGLGPTSVLSRATYYFINKLLLGRICFAYGFNTGNIRKFGERYLGYTYGEQVPYMVLERPDVCKVVWFYKFFKNVLVCKVDSPEEEFSLFFEKVKDNYELLATRDAGYLKWRYFDSPLDEYSLFAVYVRKKMIGWAVFKKQDDSLIMCDCLIDNGNSHALAFLLEYIFSIFPEITRIITWCSPSPDWWKDCLCKCGFIMQEEPNNLAPCCKVFIPQLSLNSMHVVKKLYYTMGDSDLF